MVNKKTNKPLNNPSISKFDKIKFSQPWFPVLLGLLAFLCILVIGFFTIFYTVDTSRKTYRRLYLAKATILANTAALHEDMSDKELLKRLEELWTKIPNRPPDEYLCVVAEDYCLILHTATPDIIGNDVRKNLLTGNKNHPENTLGTLISKQDTSYVGGYLSSTGQKQLAAFVKIPSRHWILGIHRSQKAILKELFVNTRFIIYGYLIVCLLLFPGTLGLFYWKVRMAQENLSEYVTALEISEAKYSQLFSEMLDGFALHEIILDEKGIPCDYKFLDVNPAFEKMIGEKREDILGKTVLEIIPTIEPAWIEHYGKVALTGEFIRFEDYSAGLDKHFEVNAFCPDKGKFATVFRDITARVNAESALRESESRFRKALVQAPFPVILHAENGEILLINQAWTDITGYSYEEIPTTQIWAEKAYGIKKDSVQEDINTLYGLETQKDEGEYIINTKSGDTRCWYFSSAPLGNLSDGRRLVISMALDMTDFKRSEEKRIQLEEELTRSQRLDSIGRLAAGIAHDYNNLLTVILGNTELLLDGKKVGNPDFESLQQIQNTVEKATGLTRQLLAFGRRQVMEIKPVDLNRLIENFVKMMKRLLGEDIELLTRFSPKIPAVLGDSISMEQVLMNLCVNARDAMPNGGKVIIETFSIHLTESLMSTHTDLHPGEWVCLSITDTGVGMTQDILSHLFEPFFTTKGIGKGTGLGLATCYGIIKQHNGDISVYSELGHGTTFRIYLPVTTEPGIAEVKIVNPPQVLQGTETILVVEDESSVRKMICTFLSEKGYKVIESLTTEDALRIVRYSQDEIDLILSDVIMPGMDGKTLYEQVKVIRPYIKVLFMSGYPDEIISPRGIIQKGIPFLQKPFNSQTLNAKIREVLDAGNKT